ncbi:MAG: hypothetical protein ACI8ZM_004945 [Crocinitomix sp.]|jgi:hypothetical protein
MEKELLQHLEFLTAIRPFRNWRNLASLKIASDYIGNEFEKYGFTIEHQKWNYGKFEYTNVIARYQPELKKRLVVGAHYDVYDDQSGADDNTSGVAGLLYLAKSIAENKPELPYGIDFISYCLEEPPHFGTKNMGSFVHAESLCKEKTELVGMICLDMIGYFSDEPNSQHYPAEYLTKRFPTTGDYIAVVGLEKHAQFATAIYERMTQAGGVDVQTINFPTNDGIAGLSDHRNYWYFGYDAVMINNTAKFRNPNYHEVTDTIETLDLKRMAAVVNGVLQAISTPLDFSSHGVAPKKDAPVATKEELSFFQRLIRKIRSLFKKN